MDLKSEHLIFPCAQLPRKTSQLPLCSNQRPFPSLLLKNHSSQVRREGKWYTSHILSLVFKVKGDERRLKKQTSKSTKSSFLYEGKNCYHSKTLQGNISSVCNSHTRKLHSNISKVSNSQTRKWAFGKKSLT